MTGERKPLGRALRFEVFKRDKFTCQYCGAKAPDVVLQVDHIRPVADGGSDDIINLVTSCEACNGGKGARKLDDSSAVERQRAQLEQLEERRQQLEMLLLWRDALAGLKDDQAGEVAARWKDKTGFDLTDTGRRNIRKWLRRYRIDEIIDAIDTSVDQYGVWEKERLTKESAEKSFNYVPRIIAVSRQSADDPDIRDLFYIRGILRNRLSYLNEWRCISLLKEARAAGATIESLRGFALSVSSWSRFVEEMDRFIEENRK